LWWERTPAAGPRRLVGSRLGRERPSHVGLGAARSLGVDGDPGAGKLGREVEGVACRAGLLASVGVADDNGRGCSTTPDECSRSPQQDSIMAGSSAKLSRATATGDPRRGDPVLPGRRSRAPIGRTGSGVVDQDVTGRRLDKSADLIGVGRVGRSNNRRPPASVIRLAVMVEGSAERETQDGGPWAAIQRRWQRRYARGDGESAPFSPVRAAIRRWWGGHRTEARRGDLAMRWYVGVVVDRWSTRGRYCLSPPGRGRPLDGSSRRVVRS